MWFAFLIGHLLLLAVVNYIDEYLTGNSKVPESANIHKRVGGLLLISTLLTFIGATAIWLFVDSVSIAQGPMMLALLSAIPMVLMFGSYFYLLLSYPSHQVVPMFLMSSLWLLLLELSSGASITITGLFGIALLIVGAYVLDAGGGQVASPNQTLTYIDPSDISLGNRPFSDSYSIC